MARIPLNFGTVADDGTGDTNRQLWSNTDANFNEVYSKAVADNTVVINEAADFPAAVAGVITLVTLTTYKIGNVSVDISPNRLVVPAGPPVILASDSAVNGQITSDTTAALITAIDGILINNNVGLKASNGKIYDFRQSVGVSLIVENTVQHAGSAAPSRLENLLIFASFFSQYLNCAAGVFDFIGASNGEFLAHVANFDTGNVGNILDVGSAVFTAFDVTQCRFVSTASNTFISSSIGSSGNIATGSIGKVLGSRITGTTPTLINVSPSDIRWEFQANNMIVNSSKAADAFLTISRTVPISSAGVFVAINGTDWSSAISERFTITTAGLATYDSAVTVVALVIATATVAKVGGGSDEIEMKVAINGVVQDKTVSSTDNASPTSVVSQGLFTLSDGDTIQIFVANIGSTSDIEVSSADMTIINGF